MAGTEVGVNGWFAHDTSDIPLEAVSYLAEQLGNKQPDLTELSFGGRSKRHHRADILEYLGFQRLKALDRTALVFWVRADLCPTGKSVAAMVGYRQVVAVSLSFARTD